VVSCFLVDFFHLVMFANSDEVANVLYSFVGNAGGMCYCLLGRNSLDCLYHCLKGP